MVALEKIKKQQCRVFFHSYDAIIKYFPEHISFFLFVKNRFVALNNTKTAHKDLIGIFIDYIYTNEEEIKEEYIPAEKLAARIKLCREIFNSRYKTLFNIARLPKDKGEIKEDLFGYEKKCIDVFEQIEQRVDGIEDITEEDKELLKKTKLLDEFAFIRDFAVFIYANRENEPIDFFKRFFFVYPFEKESDNVAEENAEWRKYHGEKVEIIKKDRAADSEEIKEARNWYANQLEKIDVDSLSEKEKADFFLEAFVAFGNVSSEKTGSTTGFTVSLRNLLYLGRYYNIHILPCRFFEGEDAKTEGKKIIEELAYSTWRIISGQDFPKIEKIKKAIRKANTNVALDSELFGKLSRRTGLDTVKKILPYGAPISKEDNDLFDVMSKFASHAPLGNIPANKEECVQYGYNYLKETGIPELITDEIKEAWRGRLLESGKIMKITPEMYYVLSTIFYLKKPILGILTHHWVYELKVKNVSELFLNEVRVILEKILIK